MANAWCPWECTTANYGFDDCISEPGAVPSEGDIGMCYTCGGWWQLVKGERVKYTPTDEELRLVTIELGESRRRAEVDAKRKGKRLK